MRPQSKVCQVNGVPGTGPRGLVRSVSENQHRWISLDSLMLENSHKCWAYSCKAMILIILKDALDDLQSSEDRTPVYVLWESCSQKGGGACMWMLSACKRYRAVRLPTHPLTVMDFLQGWCASEVAYSFISQMTATSTLFLSVFFWLLIYKKVWAAWCHASNRVVVLEADTVVDCRALWLMTML